MTSTAKTRVQIIAAATAGLGLRLWFIKNYATNDTGDSLFYIELAWNWLKHGVYGFPVYWHLTPVDMRVPGYPAFLAAVFAFAGQSTHAVMLAQAVLDVVTCFVIAAIAAWMAPRESRRRVGLAALWLAALCPFTANFTAVVLTETLVTFLTAVAILALLETDCGRALEADFSEAGMARPMRWMAAGLITGFGTLVRPETPLLLFAGGFVLLAKWRKPKDWGRLVRAGVWLGAGLVLPLVPWAARNLRTLHKVQFLAPRYSELPGEYTAIGFNAWTNSWLWRFRDVYTTQWNLNDAEINIDDLPSYAFDSPQEKQRIADLLDQYNDTLTMNKTLDDQFAEIARERDRRHHLRRWVELPFLRSLTLWFTPRVSLLPVSGHFFPIASEWEDDRGDFLTTLAMVAINLFYVGIALAGMWRSRGRAGWALLVIFIVVRTLFFTQIETVEPRYMLECFPALIALGAQAFARGNQLSSTGSG
ncbi:MAG TPA: glycosyltransferase family 39 protein [Candidatus Acidoferrum sp.]|nr:glycosyltransferase family 39 protein [Candidatus Acidoferrum sp.]